jgi:hypothetical protein
VYWSPPAPLTVLPLAPQPYLVILVPTGPSSTSPVLRLLALASSRKFHNATILRTTPFMAFIHAHTSARPSFRLPSRLSPHVTRISSLEFLQKSKLVPPREDHRGLTQFGDKVKRETVHTRNSTRIPNTEPGSSCSERSLIHHR